MNKDRENSFEKEICENQSNEYLNNLLMFQNKIQINNENFKENLIIDDKSRLENC